jgi:Tol biopolymer transport system component
VKIATGDYSDPTWSPNGDRILVIGPSVITIEFDPETDNEALFFLDVSGIYPQKPE